MQAVTLFKSYFGGSFDEDAIRNNFVLIYELLDGMSTEHFLIHFLLKKTFRVIRNNSFTEVIIMDMFDEGVSVTVLFFFPGTLWCGLGYIPFFIFHGKLKIPREP